VIPTIIVFPIWISATAWPGELANVQVFLKGCARINNNNIACEVGVATTSSMDPPPPLGFSFLALFDTPAEEKGVFHGTVTYNEE